MKTFKDSTIYRIRNQITVNKAIVCKTPMRTTWTIYVFKDGDIVQDETRWEEAAICEVFTWENALHLGELLEGK